MLTDGWHNRAFRNTGPITALTSLTSLPPNNRYYGSDAKRSPLDRYRAPGDPEYDGA